MRRAASTTPTRESTAPAPAPVARPVAPPAEKPAPKKRLSRAEAERYFLDAAAEYKGARPQEALRRFRIIAQLGPKDADLQGRVLLNLGHITEGLGNCPGAKKYYQRAAKLVAPDARLRPDLEARLLRTKEACP